MTEKSIQIRCIIECRLFTRILADCSDVSDFKWMSQLRFYVEEDESEIFIRQTNTEQMYGFEYLGNSGRLAITPLTDRCYITLTTAMRLFRGGSPKGPAGTGKTETVKDLGKNLAYYVIVINCSDGLDYKSMGRMFSGIVLYNYNLYIILKITIKRNHFFNYFNTSIIIKIIK